MYKKRKGHKVLMFFTSMFLTIFIVGSGMFMVLFDAIEPDRTVNNSPAEQSNIRLLFCETDNNLSYEINIDFKFKGIRVKRLEFDNSIYHKKGLSGTLKQAEQLSGIFDGALFATESQAAALIDYSGGYACNVGEHISDLCGGIGTGYRTLTGVAIIKIFSKEKQNRALCLDIFQAVTTNWCKILQEPRNYFKLLDLTTNNLSYKNYLPISEKFNEIVG